MLPVESLCWRLLHAFLSFFLNVHLLKTALPVGNCLSCSGGPSKRKSKDYWGGGKTLEAAVFLVIFTK